MSERLPEPRAALAVTWRGAPLSGWKAACAVLAADVEDVDLVVEGEGLAMCVAGGSPRSDRDPALIQIPLVARARVADRDVTREDVARWLGADGRHPGLDEVVPPFAAMVHDSASGAIRAATDFLGFRCLYVAEGSGWAALSTSTRALAALTGASTDLTSLAAYSLIGWRIGDRTHYDGVSVLPPGTSARLCDGRLQTWTALPTDLPASNGTGAVQSAARQLRTFVNALLDDHPDTCLQLTGGLDSRLLLGAIEAPRRPQVRAMTLQAPDNPDATIAAALATRYGMDHQVVDVTTTGLLEPDVAAALALTGAHRVDYSADPLAWASLDVVERSVPQGARLSGLGGEVVRGFYYIGRPRPVATSARRVAGLARWRLFPNESVPDEILDPGFAESRRDMTVSELERIFAALHRTWPEATDGFYLWQRMRRWAGATTTSTCQQRYAVNPMLDPRFIAVGAQVAPRERAGMQFLSRILLELDADLGDRPLDGRPPPSVYAHPGPVNRTRLGALTMRKVGGKVWQRMGSHTRPPEGGVLLADRVLQHWRRDPRDLAALAGAPFLRSGVLDRILDGDVRPTPTTIGFLATLAAADQNVAT